MSKLREVVGVHWERIDGVLIARDIDETVRRVCEHHDRKATRTTSDHPMNDGDYAIRGRLQYRPRLRVISGGGA